MKARLEPKRVKGKTSCRTIQEELNDNPYDSFRVEEDLGPVKALLYTIRNGAYGLAKWMKYVKRV